MGFARHAEALGLHSVWVSDHLVLPTRITSKYPYSNDGVLAQTAETPFLDPIGTLFFVAACTERILLGSSVLVLGYRPPILTAKAFTSLDVLSGGRALLGVGIGWMKEEFDALGMPFDQRGKRADEQLALFERLFSDEVPSFHGEYYDVPDIGFEPKPLAGKIPLWIGGDSEAALQRVARFGDMFHAAFQPPEELASKWERVCTLVEASGRHRSTLGLSVRIFLDPDAHMPPDRSIAGSIDQMIETVATFAAVGVDHILLEPVARGGIAARRSAMERLMLEVAPHFAEGTD